MNSKIPYSNAFIARTLLIIVTYNVNTLHSHVTLLTSTGKTNFVIRIAINKSFSLNLSVSTIHTKKCTSQILYPHPLKILTFFSVVTIF